MKKKKSAGGSNWMDTYGDMVTLLLCFFVLLYSMSTISEEKWKAIVTSFNPNAIEESSETPGYGGPNSEDIGGAGEVAGPKQDEIDMEMDELYQTLTQLVAQSGAGSDISVTKGDGYVFISFNEAVFFDPDRYELRPDGQELLTNVAGIMDEAKDAIDEVQILGHTAQADPRRPNNARKDRFLASNRATEVLLHIQDHSDLDPARLVSVGYGQWRPAALNNDSEGRAQNRRVEMIITGMNLESALGDSLQRYQSQRTGELPKTDVQQTPAPTPQQNAGNE
ncbi:MAG: flagellar motor protein MotB [Oscillospiraceae bacterium]|nr:flagellar motor protein MotB [Oscillospiraceae bacterium]